MVDNFLRSFLNEDFSHFTVKETGFDSENHIFIKADTGHIFLVGHHIGTKLKEKKTK
jgi:hypothetical protein